MDKRKVLSEIYEMLDGGKKESPIYNLILDYWRNEDPTKFEERKRALHEFFGHGERKDRVCKAYFKSIGKLGETTASIKRRDRTSLNKLRLLHYAFDFPLELIHKDLKDLVLYPMEGLYGINRRTKFIKLSTTPDQLEVGEYGLKYYKHLVPLVKMADKFLKAYTFLGRSSKIPKSDFKDITTLYGKAHETIYAELELKIEKDFEYIRVFALPPSSRDVEFTSDTKVRKSSQALLAMDLSTLKHVCNCLKTSNDNVQFYINYVPYRLYHYGLLASKNDKFVLISEYYKYKLHGEYVPHFMFMEHGTLQHASELILAYEDEIHKVMSRSERGFLLTPSLLVQAVSSASNYLARKNDLMIKNDVYGLRDIFKTKMKSLKEKAKCILKAFEGNEKIGTHFIDLKKSIKVLDNFTSIR